jgi:GNAT superfamily N-acetyltransferase
MSGNIHLRRATRDDVSFLVEYNRAMAWETEHKQLDVGVLTKGVEAVLDDVKKGFYVVAEVDGSVAGQLMITTEWSDWRNAWVWWIQSVYVRSEARRLGVFRALYHEVKRLAREAGDVIGLRLYVERENHAAQKTYRSLGMNDGGYLLFELVPMT